MRVRSRVRVRVGVRLDAEVDRAKHRQHQRFGVVDLVIIMDLVKVNTYTPIPKSAWINHVKI